MSVFLILGTRPQIIKSTPVILEAERQSLDLKVVHTGQHYDYSLSQVFFDELSPPQPFINLEVGSGTQIYQISEIILRLEKLLDSETLARSRGRTMSWSTYWGP